MNVFLRLLETSDALQPTSRSFQIYVYTAVHASHPKDYQSISHKERLFAVSVVINLHIETRIRNGVFRDLSEGLFELTR